MAEMFSKKELDEVKEVWKTFDANGDGHITVDELTDIMGKLGHESNQSKLKEMIAAVDKDGNGTIEWNEFLVILHNMKDSEFSKVVDDAKGLVQMKTATGVHSFAEEEKVALANYVIDVMSTCEGSPFWLDKHCAMLGKELTPEGNDIFIQIADGVIFCKMINHAFEDTIDERCVNLPRYTKGEKKGEKKKLSVFEITQNLNLVINSAMAIGCTVVNIGAEDLQDPKNVHIILGLLWQIVKRGLMAEVSLMENPDLAVLLRDGEDLSVLLNMDSKDLLLRWVNHHLAKAGCDRKMKNFDKDIRDGVIYTHLLHQLGISQDVKDDPSLLKGDWPAHSKDAMLAEEDTLKRAEMICECADVLGCRKFVAPMDIKKGNANLNLAFVATLFNTVPGLAEEVQQRRRLSMDEMDLIGETREDKAFRFWINGLGVTKPIQHLTLGLNDGIVLLKVMDRVHPGIVDWKKVNQKMPLNTFKKVENCNYAVVLGKQMKFSLVGIGGKDIVDGKKMLILGLVWQLMRKHMLNLLKAVSGGKKGDADESEILAWANQEVSGEGNESLCISGFNDSTIADSKFLAALENCVEPGCIFTDMFEDDPVKNARYVIGVARKLGCQVFALPEDIVEVKPKMIMLLVASLMLLSKGVDYTKVRRTTVVNTE